MPASVLEAVDISVEFAGLRALDRVSLCLEPGEILGLIGPNGSGKTTLVNVLTGQLAPVAGRVLCNGEDITGLPPHRVAARGIARSFQIVRLFRNLTVRENVEAGAIARGLGRPRGARGRGWAACGVRPRRRRPTSSPGASATATSGASRSPARSPRRRPSCCSTSRRPA